MPMTKQKLEEFRRDVERKTIEKKREIQPIVDYFESKKSSFESLYKFVFLFAEAKFPSNVKIEKTKARLMKDRSMAELMEGLFEVVGEKKFKPGEMKSDICKALPEIKQFLNVSQNKFATDEYNEVEDFLNGLERLTCDQNIG